MHPRPLENLVNQFSGEDLRASGLGELQTDLERLRSSAIENMKLLVDRGESMATLVTMTEGLSTNAKAFKKASRDVKKKIICDAYFGWVMVILITLLMGILVYFLLLKR